MSLITLHNVSYSPECTRIPPLEGALFEVHALRQGLHYDAEGRVALVPLGSDEYHALSEDESLKQLRAMRSKRA